MSLPATRERIDEIAAFWDADDTPAHPYIRDLIDTAKAYHAAADELEELRTKRLMSVIFGTPEGTACAKSFGIYRQPDGDNGRIVAHGAEFPDGAIALRWVGEPGTSIAFNGDGLEALKAILDQNDAMQIVWYSEELEPLAAMEELIDRVLAIAETPPVGYPLPTRSIGEARFNEGVAVMAAQVRDLIKAARAVTSDA